ncbi:MAG: hypothetical protein ACE5L6_02170 [Candidatus Bathyarchaeia archaeon]
MPWIGIGLAIVFLKFYYKLKTRRARDRFYEKLKEVKRVKVKVKDKEYPEIEMPPLEEVMKLRSTNRPIIPRRLPKPGSKALRKVDLGSHMKPSKHQHKWYQRSIHSKEKMED